MDMRGRKRRPARIVRQVEALRFYGIPGSVVVRISTADDAGRTTETGLGELSIGVALRMAQCILDECVKAAEAADAMPHDLMRQGDAA